MGAVIVADVTHDYGGSDPPPMLKPISNLMAGLSHGLYPPPKLELKPMSNLMAYSHRQN